MSTCLAYAEMTAKRAELKEALQKACAERDAANATVRSPQPRVVLITLNSWHDFHSVRILYVFSQNQRYEIRGSCPDRDLGSMSSSKCCVRRWVRIKTKQIKHGRNRRGCHVEAGEGATWRQERVPRGGRRGCHVEAGEGAMWRQEGATFAVPCFC